VQPEFTPTDIARPTDVLSAGPPEAGLAQPGPRRRARTPLILAIVVVLTLAAAGAAYAGLRLWYGSGAQPEDVTPASAAAFVRLDFDPGLNQGRRLESLLKKFPDGAKDTQSRLDGIERSLLRELGLRDLDFTADIKPWFGNRVGVAVWRNADKEPVVLLLLASKDDAKARAALGNVRSRHDGGAFGYVLTSGYAVVARGERHAQADAEAAAKEASEHSLAKLKEFTAAVGTLPPDQTALGWVDLSASTKLLDTGNLGTGNYGSFVPFGLLGGPPAAGNPLSDLTGRVVLGAQAVDNGVEVRVRATGLSAVPHVTQNVRSTLDALPGNSIVAGAISQDPSDRRGGGLGAAGLGGLFVPGLFGGLDSGMIDSPDANSPDAKELQEMSRKLSEGMAALFNSKLIAGSLTTIGDRMPGLMLVAETEGEAAARQVVDGATAFGPAGLTATAQGGRVEIKTGAYAPSGKLIDAPLYREAMEGTPHAPFQAYFVDLTRLANSAMVRNPTPVKALGVGFAVDGTDTVGLIRIVVR
jgi:Protein of unknown function (DUF3352)